MSPPYLLSPCLQNLYLTIWAYFNLSVYLSMMLATKWLKMGQGLALSSLVKYADNKYYSFDEELCFLSKAPHRFVLNGISLLWMTSKGEINFLKRRQSTDWCSMISLNKHVKSGHLRSSAQNKALLYDKCSISLHHPWYDLFAIDSS